MNFCETGITLIIGPTGSGKNSLLEKILRDSVICQKIIVEDIVDWKAYSELVNACCHSKKLDLSVFILAQSDKNVPSAIRKNAMKIIFTDVQSMRAYFARMPDDMQNILKSEEYQKIEKLIGEFSTTPAIVWFPRDKKFDVMVREYAEKNMIILV